MNLFKIFPILIRLMTRNREKLGHTVTIMEYLASVVSLIFLSKILKILKSRFDHQIH